MSSQKKQCIKKSKHQNSIAIWFPTGDWSHGILPQDDVGLLEPQNYQVAINEISGRNKISMVMKITSIIFAVLFMSHSQIGKLVKTEVQTYVLQNEASVLSRLSETVFSFFLELIGKSLLSAVVFSDICIDIFASMTTGDLEDTSMVRGTSLLLDYDWFLKQLFRFRATERNWRGH